MTPPPVTLARRPYRGFDLTLSVGDGGLFAFEVAHLGLALHASEASFRTPLAAQGAARRFIDDALAAFEADPYQTA